MYSISTPDLSHFYAGINAYNDPNPNVILGRRIALEQGIFGKEWECLYDLGIRESNWNHLAVNKSSGAFGIPQSLPAEKIATHGNIYDPEVQIKWFVDYVRDRYETSCKALAFQLRNNWY